MNNSDLSSFILYFVLGILATLVAISITGLIASMIATFQTDRALQKSIECQVDNHRRLINRIRITTDKNKSN